MPSNTSCSETRTRVTDPAGSPPLLFGAAVFLALALLLSRGVLPSQDPPAFPLEEQRGIRVLLGAGFPAPGVHHFSDGDTLESVIKLTSRGVRLAGPPAGATSGADLIDGMAISISNSDGLSPGTRVGWMPARQRLALGIPLHPDRMSHDDWVSLPGIGEKLARQIEADRQIYGDFGSFEALERVKGVGPAKLNRLREFFVVDRN